MKYNVSQECKDINDSNQRICCNIRKARSVPPLLSVIRWYSLQTHNFSWHQCLCLSISRGYCSLGTVQNIGCDDIQFNDHRFGDGCRHYQQYLHRDRVAWNHHAYRRYEL